MPNQFSTTILRVKREEGGQRIRVRYKRIQGKERKKERKKERRKEVLCRPRRGQSHDEPSSLGLFTHDPTWTEPRRTLIP
jgi:hypothetical protein